MADTERPSEKLTPQQEVEARLRVIRRQKMDHERALAACDGAIQVLEGLLQSFTSEGKADA